MSYSELSAYYEDFKTGYWRDSDPEVCPCKGHGWALSQVDTWHQCPTHFKGQRYPEDDHDEEPMPEMEEETPEASYFVDNQNLVQRGEPEDDDCPF